MAFIPGCQPHCGAMPPYPGPRREACSHTPHFVLEDSTLPPHLHRSVGKYPASVRQVPVSTGNTHTLSRSWARQRLCMGLSQPLPRLGPCPSAITVGGLTHQDSLPLAFFPSVLLRACVLAPSRPTRVSLLPPPSHPGNPGASYLPVAFRVAVLSYLDEFPGGIIPLIHSPVSCMWSLMGSLPGWTPVRASSPAPSPATELGPKAAYMR